MLAYAATDIVERRPPQPVMAGGKQRLLQDATTHQRARVNTSDHGNHRL